MQIVDLHIRVWFVAADDLAIHLLLRALLIEKYMRGIFPADCRLVPWHLHQVDTIVPVTKAAKALTVLNHIYGQPYFASIAGDSYHRVVVARVVTLASNSHTPVSVKSTGLGRIVMKPTDDKATRASLHAARRAAGVSWNQIFLILLTNVSNQPVHLPKRTSVGNVTNSLGLISATEVAPLENDPKTIGTVHYKRMVDKNTRMTGYKDVGARNDPNFKVDWKSDAQLSEN